MDQVQDVSAEPEEGGNAEKNDRPQATVQDPPSERPGDQLSGSASRKQSRKSTDRSELPSPLPTDPLQVSASEIRRGWVRNQTDGHPDGAGEPHVDPQSTPDDGNGLGGDASGGGSRKSLLRRLVFGTQRVS